MTARGELTMLILGKTAPRAADAIIAAGYRKPRTITTAEELGKLAEGVVIIDQDGDVVIADPGPEDMWFRQIDETWPLPAGAIFLPATILHEPKG